MSCLLRHMTLVAHFKRIVSCAHVQHILYRRTYLSDSFFPDVFLRFGVGILQSIEKATQLVHGTPRLAASHRTCEENKYDRKRLFDVRRIAPFAHDTSVRKLAELMYHQTGRTHFASSRCALPSGRSAMSSTTIHSYRRTSGS